MKIEVIFCFLLLHLIGSDARGILQSVKYPGKCLHIPKFENYVELDLVPCNLTSGYQLMDVESWMNYVQTPGTATIGLNCLVSGTGDVGTTADDKNGGKITAKFCLTTGKNTQWNIYNGDYFGDFQLKNVNSGKCLTAESTTNLDQYDCLDYADHLHQYWNIIFEKNTIGLLENMGNPGKCLQAKLGSDELELVPCQMWDPYQMMSLENFDVYTTFPGLISLSTGKCIIPKDGNLDTSNHVVQTKCGAQDYAYWQLSANPYKKQFRIKNGLSSYCLTAENGGTYIDQTACGSSLTQFWKARYADNPITQLQNFDKPDQCLRPAGGNFADSTNLELFSCSIDSSDQWVIFQSSDDQISYVNQNFCLTVVGRATSENTIVNEYTCTSGADNQYWILVPYERSNNPPEIVVTDDSGDGISQVDYSGAFQIQAVVSGLCATAEYKNGQGFMDLQICKNSPRQLWTFK